MTDEKQLQKITEIQARYADELMSKANVVGVAVGLKKTAGEYTTVMALVVMVSEKVPQSQLAPEDIIPNQIEGVPVDVQETGVFSAQSW
jgi:hypothetical protein